uniref:Disease resistance protein winged helix domain-containing protein n=1 Tax=Aegilops tauschii subsp. strangulata TaxID=200361 RepID=A0A453RP23_AEGTS
CSGLPLAIVTIGGFLATQQTTPLEWRKLNEHISAELELNPDLGPIMTVLNKSFDGLPYYLKPCFLYMSIFPKDREVSRRRLVRRWIAEGYSREVRGRSADEIAEGDFMELISRSMLRPSQQSIHGRKGVDACQVHDLIREISIKKSTEEDFVFTLEEGYGLSR